jgi:hypothetical protein
MIQNTRMTELLQRLERPAQREVLPDDLRRMIAHGWCVGAGGQLLLVDVAGHLREREVDPGSLGDFEFEANDLRIPDDDLVHDVDRFLPRVASRGIVFACEALDAARPFRGDILDLASIIHGCGVVSRPTRSHRY